MRRLLNDVNRVIKMHCHRQWLCAKTLSFLATYSTSCGRHDSLNRIVGLGGFHKYTKVYFYRQRLRADVPSLTAACINTSTELLLRDVISHYPSNANDIYDASLSKKICQGTLFYSHWWNKGTERIVAQHSKEALQYRVLNSWLAHNNFLWELFPWLATFVSLSSRGSWQRVTLLPALMSPHQYYLLNVTMIILYYPILGHEVYKREPLHMEEKCGHSVFYPLGLSIIFITKRSCHFSTDIWPAGTRWFQGFT